MKSIQTDIQEFMTSLTDLWREKVVATISLSGLASLCGVEDSMLFCLMVLIFVDTALGIISAFKDQTYNPRFLFRTVNKIIAYFSSTIMINLVSSYMTKAFDYPLPVTYLYIVYLISMECISVLRNLRGLGVKYPPLVDLVLTGYRNKIENTVQDMVDPDHKNEEV